MHECENAGMKELKEWKKIQESRYKIGRCGGTPFRVGVARQEYKNEKKDKELRAKRKRKCVNATMLQCMNARMRECMNERMKKNGKRFRNQDTRLVCAEGLPLELVPIFRELG
jgi:hypothetical protein